MMVQWPLLPDNPSIPFGLQIAKINGCLEQNHGLLTTSVRQLFLDYSTVCFLKIKIRLNLQNHFGLQIAKINGFCHTIIFG